MQYLVIYDSTGKIYYQASGDIQEPSGLPYLWVDIPQGKRLVSINIEVNPHEPIFEDIPVDTTTKVIQEMQREITELKEKNKSLQETVDTLVLDSLEG